MRDLPADREKALAAIAAGWGRTATAAHPDCTCGKPIPEPPRPPVPNHINDPEYSEYIEAVQVWKRWRDRGGRYHPKDCPPHGTPKAGACT